MAKKLIKDLTEEINLRKERVSSLISTREGFETLLSNLKMNLIEDIEKISPLKFRYFNVKKNEFNHAIFLDGLAPKDNSRLDFNLTIQATINLLNEVINEEWDKNKSISKAINALKA